MKKYFLLIALLPLVGLAQKNKTAVKPKVTVIAKEEIKSSPVKPADGFLIYGRITGFPEGTPIALLNGNSGVPESTSQLNKDSFKFSGKLSYPDFKLILVNNKPPYIPIFLDNSLVNVEGRSDSLEYSRIIGSASHNEFIALNNIVFPYRELFQEGNTDSVAKNKAASLIDGFVKRYPNSYISPLAIFRSFQLTADVEKMELMFAGLNQQVKLSPLGNFVTQQIIESKGKPAIGRLLPEFSLPDTTGKMISLSSLRGKYVLVDFWASWCGPCRRENPNVVATFNKYKNKNYTVLGVSFDRGTIPWIDAIKSDGLSWTHVLDYQGSENSVGQRFRIATIPQNLLIDPNGVLIARNLRGIDLENKLASLFGN